MSSDLAAQFEQQSFPNGYELVNGVQMHAENGEQFQIPHDVLKKHVRVGQFVELRIDSPRFSVHEDALDKCYCSSCLGEATKPILRHEHPHSLMPLPSYGLTSRGWGEDFWVQVVVREADFFRATIDNQLAETPLHDLQMERTIYFHADHILAVHGSHRREIVAGMNAEDLKQLAEWLGR